jgi:hypothetical protein
MGNIVAINTNNAVAIPSGVDPFANFADREGGPDGAFLKFTRGIWTIGADAETVKPEERFAALVAEMQHGYTKWVDSKVADRAMIRVADGFAPARAELGDTDEANWPVGPNGREDPWTFTIALPLLGIEDEQRLIFTTSSSGGRRALGKLSGAFAMQRRRVPGTEYPIVELGCDSYRHDKFGIVQRPLFRIVEWVAAEADPFVQSPATKTAAGDLNDSIPF